MEMLFDFDLEYDEDSPFGKDIEKDHDFFITEIKNTDATLDIELISKAFYYCVDKHKNETRKSGVPYYTHPLHVALILLRDFIFHDSQSIVAALLHDTLEDVENLEKSEIIFEFGEDIADIVDAVTKISHKNIQSNRLQQNNRELIKALTYRKLFMALIRDVRVMLIKIADRLHNMRTLHYLPQSKQVEVALETLNFYVPIAHRLGLMKAKMELENRSFYYSDRLTYEAIRESLNLKRRDFIDYIRVFSDLIQTSLINQNLKHTLSIVHKHEYEIYQMVKEGKSLSDIDNFYSMVIILNSNDVHECYRAHGVLATAFNTISFVDYIAKPKMDWYKSLYTELFGPDGKRIELLIRTEEMEKIAEEGFAATFSLKSGRFRALEFTDAEADEWGDWMQDIIQAYGDKASQIIWDAIKVNIFDSELTIYTKDGTPVSLPQGANLIDFAFAVSEDFGLHCITGKVNGVLHDLSHKLTTGDQVEIIKSPNAVPKTEWENAVVSHRAVSKLHTYFKNRQKIEIEPKSAPLNFDVKLIIKGEDRARMLYDITDAIGKSNIKRIYLDTAGSNFECAISVNIKSNDELNRIFMKLLSIKGVRSVVKKEDEK